MDIRKSINNNESGGSGPGAQGAWGWKERVPLFNKPSGSTSGTGLFKDLDNDQEGKISREAEDMLIRVLRKPHLTATLLYEDLGLSGYKGNKTREELIKQGLAANVPLKTNRRGRQKKLLEITPKGNQYLQKMGITDNHKGRGGAKHIHYQNMLKDWYEKHGYTVIIEATVGNTCLDVLVIRKDGRRLGIEIALSEQYEIVNAQKAMEAGIEHLLFVCETQSMMDKLCRKLSSLLESWPGNKPGFKLISDYLTED